MGSSQPMRAAAAGPGAERRSPEDEAGWLSRLTFAWLAPLLELGEKRPLEDEDVPPLSQMDHVGPLKQRFRQEWDEELRQSPGSEPWLFRVLLKAGGRRFLLAGPLKLLHDCLAFVGPLALRGLLAGLETGSRRQSLTFAFLMTFTTVIQSLILHNYFWMTYRASYHFQAMLATNVFDKALRLSKASSSDYTTGELVNLMAIDVDKMSVNLLPYLHLLWSGPLQISVSLFLLNRVIGFFPTLAGLAVMLLIIPANWTVTRRYVAVSEELMDKKDARIRLMNEVLNAIKQIKMFAWETRFLSKVTESRDSELAKLKKQGLLNALLIFMWSGTPVLVATAAFSTLVLVHGQAALSPASAFPALVLFNILKFPLTVLSEVVSDCVSARVSSRRLVRFLYEAGEVEGRRVTPTGQSPGFRGGRFFWAGTNNKRFTDHEKESEAVQLTSDCATPTLDSVHVDLPAKGLVAVVGPVGAGKSSLLSALLGEMEFYGEEYATLPSSVSYAPQTAWIQAGTIRDNIVFGQEMDQSRYNRVVSVCALTQDLQELPGGDLAEIGEHGVNLSGGQKARVGLARALYKDSEIYLLDDPLSALDVHVGEHVFEKGIKEFLSNKTCILVTHHRRFLSEADQVLEVSKNGHVAAKTGVRDTSVESPQPVEYNLPSKTASSSPAVNIVRDEERSTGRVDKAVYRYYFFAIGAALLAGCVFTVIAMQVSVLSFDAWLTKWSNDVIHNRQLQTHKGPKFYLAVYLALGFTGATFTMAWGVVTAFGRVRASRSLHFGMLRSVLRAPTSFFDATPVGRILNRFAKDIDAVDENLPSSLRNYASTVASVCTALCVVALSTPVGLLAIVPLGFIYRRLGQRFLSTSRELKRLESISKSPVYAHFGEAISGSAVIRAFDSTRTFQTENERLFSLSLQRSLGVAQANRWLSLRVDFVGNLLVLSSTLSAIMAGSSLSAAVAGLSVTYAMKITSTLGWMVRGGTDVETRMNAVERISFYSNLASEAEEVTSADSELTEWPSHGDIKFRNVTLRYRDDLPVVLKGLTFDIPAGKKTFLCGRTGSGKSSVATALWRLVEIEDGEISIDGVDIGRAGLHTLRSRMTIISQDPVLFTGTLRNQLDPFEEYSDREIWNILERVCLKAHVAGMALKLDSTVSEGGGNFSQGQRQLLCLGRALLRKTKIILMDEATASCDFETDAVIQQAVRELDCTLVLIAHRLDSVADADHVVVLDNGRVSESGTPRQLLQNPASALSQMVGRLSESNARDIQRRVNADL